MSSGATDPAVETGAASLVWILRTCWRRRRIFILVASLIFSIFAINILQMRPIYSAEALLLLSTDPVINLSESASPSRLANAMEPYAVRTEVEILTSDQLARRVIEKENLLALEEFKPSKTEPSLASSLKQRLKELVSASASSTAEKPNDTSLPAAVGQYLSKLSVFNDGRSLIVRIGFSSEAPDIASRLANAHAETYRAEQLARRLERQDRAIHWLGSELERRAAEMREAEAAVQAFRADHGLIVAPRRTAAGLVRDDEITSLNERVPELRNLESITAAKRIIYEAVLGRYNIAVSEKAFNAPDARVVSAATTPTSPSYPKTPLFLIVALGVASLFGVGAALGAERLRTRPQELRDIADLASARPLGSVPLIDLRKHRLRTGGEHQVLAEQMREIRDLIGGNTTGHGGLIVAVTCSLPSEGKSLVAISLARAFASAGTPTLLVDADLRRPTVSELLGAERREAGLPEALTGATDVEAAIISADGLHILPARPGQDDKVDLLSGPLMDSLLERLREHYSVIVIDTAPLGIVPDALHIAALADKTIVVVRSGWTSVAVLQRTVTLLREASARIAGVVSTHRRMPPGASSIASELRRYSRSRVTAA